MIDYYTKSTVVEVHCVKITCNKCNCVIEDKQCYSDGWFDDSSGISASEVYVQSDPHFSMYFSGCREGNLCEKCAKEFNAEILKWANQLNKIYDQFGITEDN